MSTKLTQPSFLLWTTLLLLAPLYSHENLGGLGLELSFNISVWLVASWFISTCFFFSKDKFKLPQNLWLFGIFPIYIFLNVLGGAGEIFTFLFIFLGIAFIVMLFQLKLSQALIDNWLYMIVLAAGLQSIISIFQIWLPSSVVSQFFYSATDSVPRGVFQQVNVNASFLATGVCISVYLISRPWFKSAGFIKKLMLFIAYTLAIYVVFASGSRAGLLALMLAVPLLLASRFTQFKQQINTIIILALLTLPSFFIGHAGLEKTIDKTVQLKEQSYSNARIAIYTIAGELLIKQPMGYGQGNFFSAWNPQASDFVQRYPETQLPNTINHPHNEFLMWTTLGGVPALIGLILIVIGICIGLWKCGFQRGGAYAALLIPISLHTQVELPFYLSSLHWFVWLFLVFVVLRHNTISVGLNISVAAAKAVKFSSVVFAVFSTLFLVNTAYAQKDIYNFVRGIKTDTAPLSIALNNLNTKNYAEQLAMRSMLYHSIENNNAEKVSQFEKWALKYIEKSPELKMYEDLISASSFLRPSGKGCDAIDAGYQMYAHNKALQGARVNCINEGLIQLN